jgi:RNA polymerase sigma-70 factor (ECF subfamily)
MSNDHPSFATTHWSHVWRAVEGGSTGRGAWQSLCQQYWYPLYAFLRRSGHPSHAAEDLVQGFFADLLDREALQRADPERGRFRSFLLASCRNYAANQQRSSRAERRGGGRGPISLAVGGEPAEQHYHREPADLDTPERLFERRWALAVIEASLERLAAEYRALGRPQWFEAMRPFLAPVEHSPSLDDVARQLQMTPGAMRVALHRLRKRFGEALREEVRRTVGPDDNVDEELQSLLRALAG